MQERLQKILARAGVASRRAAEDLIEQGRVTVNGTTITELGSRADPETDHIKVDGKRISMPSQHVYLLLNKPKGVMSTVSDPEGRPVVTDLIKGVKGRIYPVGRLDFQSEGALMLTNDGDLMNSLLAARSKCHKTYLVKVSGIPDAKNLGRLERGVTIEGLRYSGCEITLFDTPKNAWLRVVLYEGKKQHLRKIFDHIGHSVTKLKRISFAGLELDDLEPGQFRHLTNEEVAQLKSGNYAPPPSGMKELDKAGVPVKKPEYRADRRPVRGRRPAASGAPRPRTGPSADRPKSGPRREGSSSADRSTRTAQGKDSRPPRPRSERDSQSRDSRPSRPRSERDSQARDSRPSRPRPERDSQSRDSRPSRPRPERDSQSRDSRPSRPRPERDSQSRDSRPSRPRPERDSQSRDSRPSRPRPERDSQSRDSRPGDSRKTRSSDSRTRRDQPAPGKPRSRSGSGGSSTSRSGRPGGGSRSQTKQGSRGGFGGSRGGKGSGPKGGGQGGGRRGGGHRG